MLFPFFFFLSLFFLLSLLFLSFSLALLSLLFSFFFLLSHFLISSFSLSTPPSFLSFSPLSTLAFINPSSQSAGIDREEKTEAYAASIKAWDAKGRNGGNAFNAWNGGNAQKAFGQTRKRGGRPRVKKDVTFVCLALSGRLHASLPLPNSTLLLL